MADDFRRITIRSLKDTLTGAYSLTDYGKDIRTIERALKSVLPEEAFYHKVKDINYDDPTFHQIGKLKEDFYVKKSYSAVAQQVIDQALEKMVYKDSADPKYWATRTRTLSNEENATLKSLEELKQKNDEESEPARFRRGTLLKILGLLTAVVDIGRRILSSVLNMASQQLRDSVEAHNLGLSREEYRNYRRIETTHGMKEGTFTEAIAGEQQKYGNITSLDEKSLEYIALIMGNKVSEMATMGLGAINPEAIVEAIVNRANELANAGYNSIGQYVGEAQARRELYSYLLKYSPQIADIFATMQEEQHNINSIFREQLDTYAKFKSSASEQRGTTQAGEGVLVTLGQEWGVFQRLLGDIKHALAVSVAPVLTKILRRLNNMRVGMSESEKLKLNIQNRDANEKAIKETEASIAYLETKAGGDVTNLSKSEKAYYDTLVQYKKDLEAENKKKAIDDITRTPNELKVEQERRLKENAKFLSTLIRSGEADLDDPRYKGYYQFSNDEIMRVISAQGDSKYGEKALAKFKETYITKRMKELRKTTKGVPESVLRQTAENDSVKAFARTYYKFFYPTLLELQAEDIISQSYNDQTYDIDRARERWGANFENLSSELPDEALGTHKLYSVDVKDGTTTVHKLILDLNDNGVDKGDFEVASWTGNDRGGAQGSQTSMTYDKQHGVSINALATTPSQIQNK